MADPTSFWSGSKWIHTILNKEHALQCKHILYFMPRSVTEVADNMPLSHGADLLVYLRNKKNDKIDKF